MVTQTSVLETPSPSLLPSIHSDSSQRHVKILLNYYDDPGDGSPPVPVYVGGGTVKNERPTKPTPVVVHDISGEEDQYTLSSHGFQLVHHESQEQDFVDEEKIQNEYYPEIDRLVKELTGAVRVHFFGHNIRRGPSNWHSLGVGNRARKGPLHRVHIDQSNDGAEIIIRTHLPDEADQLMKRRWQIINIWRPIKTIYKDPLAVASAQSIPDADLIPASVVYPNTRTETFSVLPNPSHKWYYKNEQKPDEVLFIKCFDTDKSVASRIPHSAFHDEERGGMDDRQSIEVRALIFY